MALKICESQTHVLKVLYLILITDSVEIWICVLADPQNPPTHISAHEQ